MSNRKALVVGIDNYSRCPLASCCNDSEAVKDLLANHGNGDPNFEVWKKDNVQTKAELRSLIEKCFEGDAEVALFYYSGHGHIDSVGGYLVTPDFQEFDMGVSLQDVLTIANRSRCKERIIILDCCYSGLMGNIITADQNTAIINEGVTILTASRKDEPSIGGSNYSVFTALLLEALEGGAADILGHITVGSIYAFIDKALGTWEQRPVFKTNVTRFTSLRNVEPQVDIKIIRNIGNYFSNENSKLSLDPSFEWTNSPDIKHEYVEPYANPKNIVVFSELQKLEGIGLVVPVGEEHMYFAAMNSKACQLTAVGKHYWNLVKKGKI